MSLFFQQIKRGLAALDVFYNAYIAVVFQIRSA